MEKYMNKPVDCIFTDEDIVKEYERSTDIKRVEAAYCLTNVENEAEIYDKLEKIASNKKEKLIDEVTKLRKSKNISQDELAKIIGISKQTISRIEKKNHSLSLKLFCSIVHALGYELKIIKRKQ